MTLIDKDALVAEIERLRRVRPSDSLQPTEENKLDWLAGKAFCTASLKVFLDTLEVKDVDLDFQRFAKEMEIVFNLPSSETENTEENPLNWEFAIAKHFFELGLKTQKGE